VNTRNSFSPISNDEHSGTFNQTTHHTQPHAFVIVAKQNLRGSILHTRLLDRFPCTIEFYDDIATTLQPGVRGDVFLIDGLGVSGQAIADIVRALEVDAGDAPSRKAMFFNVSPEANRDLRRCYTGWRGLRGVFATRTDVGQVLRGIGAVLDNDYWLPRSYFSALLDRGAPAAEKPQLTPAEDPGLTQKEGQILRILVTGKTNEEIAEMLSISPHTVKTHVYNLYKKLGVNNRVEASNWAQSYMQIRG